LNPKRKKEKEKEKEKEKKKTKDEKKNLQDLEACLLMLQ